MNKPLFTSLLVFVVVIFSFMGCKKVSTPNGKVKGQTYQNQFSDTTIIDTLSYTYDQQGRVISIQHINGKETYSFSGNSYIYTPVSGPPITGTLNEKGLLISTSNGFTYNYDEKGYLVSSVSANLSMYYTINNGNIMVDSQNANGNNSFEYYTYTDIVDYRDFGRSFMGQTNHNLVSRDSVPSARQTNIMSYTFDSKGRVSTETTSGGNGILFIHSYTYFD